MRRRTAMAPLAVMVVGAGAWLPTGAAAAPDTRPPVPAGAALSGPAQHSAVGSTVAVTTRFFFTDDRGICRVAAERQTGSGRWTPVPAKVGTGKSVEARVEQPLRFGARYRYRSRARDCAGHWSRWSYGVALTARLLQESDRAISYHTPTWTAVRSPQWLGGSARRGTSLAEASVDYTGFAIGWVGRLGPRLESSASFYDSSPPQAGAREVLVYLTAKQDQYRRLVHTWSWPDQSDKARRSFLSWDTEVGDRFDLDAVVVLRRSA